MFRRVTLLLACCLIPISTVPIIVYEMARFDPANPMALISIVDLITTLNDCVCQCYGNSLCVTGTYFEKNQNCLLFDAHLEQGEVRISNDAPTTIFSFPKNRISDASVPPAMMEWLFDGNFIDTYNTWNGSFISSQVGIDEKSEELWVSPGYAGHGSAVHFPPNSYYTLGQNFNLATSSFTVSAWFVVTLNYTMLWYDYFSLFVHCQKTDVDQCLHLVIGKDYIRLGFFNDDLVVSTSINLNQWYHVAYVYDRSASIQHIYLNGYGDVIYFRRFAQPYLGNSSTIALGAVPLMASTNLSSGYIDKITFVSRVKNDSEILTEATLVAYYPFDGSYFDAGPNLIMNTTQVGTMFDSAGQVRQALLFDTHVTAYFQSNGFYYLGITNYSYSFALWIYPFASIGTILQVSSSNGWSVPMIGFNDTGYLTGQTLGHGGAYAVSSDTQLPLQTWSHVSLTYSISRGIRLFVNGNLVSVNSTQSDYLASDQMCIITLGTFLPPISNAMGNNSISLDQYPGKIDEVKIFSRELTSDEIAELF